MLITWFQTLTQTPRFFRGWSLLFGVISGLIFLCASTLLWLRLGITHEVNAAIMLTVALGCCLMRTTPERKPGSIFRVCLLLMTAGLWTLLLPLVLRGLLGCLGALPLTWFETPGVSFILIQILTLIGLSPVVLAACVSYENSRQCDLASQVQWQAGLALSLLLLPPLVLPFLGTVAVGYLGIAGCGMALVAGRRRGTLLPPATEEAVASSHASDSPMSPLLPLLAAGTGGLLVVSLFIAGQLIPRNLIEDGALLAGLALGFCGASLIRRQISGPVASGTLCLRLALCGVVLAAGYPLWTRICLNINAWASQLSLIVAARSGLLAGLMLPIGFLAGRILAAPGTRGQRSILPLCLGAGFALTSHLPWAPWKISAGLTGFFLLTGMCVVIRNWSESCSTRVRQAGFGLTAGATILGLVNIRNLDPGNSERILFSAAALQSLRQGVSARQLNWIDDSRQIAEFTTLTNRVSLWRQRGSQVLLRQNGMILGLHSTDTGLGPHHAGDLLPALLPLAMHPAPEHVLIMGVHPPTLLTCHTWPLRTVHCIDGAAESHRLLNWLTSTPSGALHLDNGPEFHFHQADPILSLYGRHAKQYDLISCPITHAGSSSTLNQLTREFYLQVCSHLSEDGIFSQRLPYYDLGPEVVQQVVSTLLSVFGEVRAVESIPGELIFLCSVRKLPEIDDHFVERLKSPQIRTLLGQAGWDWSLILGRGGVDHEHLKEFCAGKAPVNTCSQNTLSFRLPMEVARWGRKGDATRASLAKYGDAIRTSLGDSSSGKEVAERLEDLNLAHQIQRDHPNDPWAYRAALKARLQNRPRAAILPVNHQLKRVLDPEDQRRKDYLLALGPAAKNRHPSPAAIQELATFEAPFDPLVSLFVYFETANLFERCDPPETVQQLRHLLHTVYFSSGYDQSIRNVADALVILCEHPEAVADDAARWDEINSLMQIMAQRWQMRLGDQKLSRYEATDTERSLQSIEAGMSALETHYRLAGLTEQEWSLRKQTLEQALIRPLRQHRSTQAREVRLTAPSKVR